MTLVSLAETALLTPGFAFKSSTFGEYPAKVIKIANVAEDLNSKDLSGVDISGYPSAKIEKHLVHPGDYFIAMTGSIGKVGRLRHGTAYLNQRVLGIRPYKDIDKDFVWYLINTSDFRNHLLSHIDSHSVQANISANSVGQFLFDLPSLPTQQQITSVLKPLDDKIELNNRINDYLAA